MTIINASLSKNEKMLLDFFLCSKPLLKNVVSKQINEAKIRRQISPYFCILQFFYTEPPPQIDFISNADPTVQVIHDDGAPPTAFIMHIRNGILTEFECFNGDSSELNFDKLCEGEVFIET